MARVIPAGNGTTPWEINDNGLRRQAASIEAQKARNNELEDQLTYPMRRYSASMADGAAARQNATMARDAGFQVSSSGNPMTGTPQRRFQSRQPGNPAFFDEFMSTLQANGLTNPYALATVAATGQAESGWSRVHDEWDDPSESGEHGRSGLALSWRNERLQAAREFARQRGDDPNAPSAETQALFFLSEPQNQEMIRKLQNAGSVQEGIMAIKPVWGYADRDGGQTRARLATADSYLHTFTGRRMTASQLESAQGAVTQQSPTSTLSDDIGEYSIVPMTDSRYGFLKIQPGMENRFALDTDAPVGPDGKLRVRVYTPQTMEEPTLGPAPTTTAQPAPRRPGDQAAFDSFNGGF